MGSLPVAVVNLGQGATTFAILLLAVALLSLVGLILNANGHTPFAVVLLSSMIYGASVFTIIDGAGLADPGVLSLPILILLATFYFGRRGAFASTTLSIGTLVALQVLVAQGILDLPGSYSAGRLLVSSVLLLALAALGWVVSSAWEGSLDELRRTEGRLELAISGARLGIWDWDIPSDSLTVSSPWSGPGQLPPAPASMKAWRDTLHPDDRDRVVSSLEECLKGKTPSVSAEYRVRADPGPWAWRLAMGRLTNWDAEGSPVRMAGVVVDITETRQAQEDLLASERRYRLLSRELHDSVTQTLYSVRLTLEAARLAMGRDRERMAGLLAQVDSLAKSALDEMRNLLRQARPEALEQQGLVAALQDHIAALRAREELDVEYQVVGDRELTVEQELALYRAAQEALSNVSKHSGARTARLIIDLSRDPMVLEVEDQGVGFDPHRLDPRAGGLGMTSMRERVEALGGGLTVRSSPGEGTRLRFEVPVVSGGAHGGP